MTSLQCQMAKLTEPDHALADRQQGLKTTWQTGASKRYDTDVPDVLKHFAAVASNNPDD